MLIIDQCDDIDAVLAVAGLFDVTCHDTGYECELYEWRRTAGHLTYGHVIGADGCGLQRWKDSLKTILKNG